MSLINDDLVLRESHGWFLIERYEAPGEHREWYEQSQHGHAYMHSARISDADIEGTADEMEAIVHAIETRGEAHFKRCAVVCRSSYVQLWSPRNSRHHALVTFDAADRLVVSMRHVLSGEVL